MHKTQDCPLCGCPAIPLIQSGPSSYAHCPLCKGISMDRDQLLGPKEEWDFYLGHNNDVHDSRYQNFVRPLVNLIELRQNPSHKGLDFGAGSGPVISHMLQERGYSMYLYDPFFYPNLSVLETQYRFIVACEVIEHFHNPGSSFGQLLRLLEPRGTLYCRTTLIPDQIGFDRWHYKNDATHVFFYHEETVAWIAQNILSCEYTIIDRNLMFFSRS
nr:class I SAM-dependent methyltransferase [uncultured Sphaerochaeta sp.]